MGESSHSLKCDYFKDNVIFPNSVHVSRLQVNCKCLPELAVPQWVSQLWQIIQPGAAFQLVQAARACYHADTPVRWKLLVSSFRSLVFSLCSSLFTETHFGAFSQQRSEASALHSV